MHHISVVIESDSDSDGSEDDSTNYMYDDLGDDRIFMQRWGADLEDPEEKDSEDGEEKTEESIKRDEIKEDALMHIKNARKGLKAAVTEITKMQSLIKLLCDEEGKYGVERVAGEKEPPADIVDQVYEIQEQFSAQSEYLLTSAKTLREQVNKSRVYFHSLSMLSEKLLLKQIKDENGNTQISVATPAQTTTNIILTEDHTFEGNLKWKLSDDFRFSFNGNSFDMNEGPYSSCFFEMMCHELFNRIKNDTIKSAIHYTADRNSRTVYFDVGNGEPWKFELNKESEMEIGEVPVWMPRLMGQIIRPNEHPASFMRKLLFFQATLNSMSEAFCERFLNLDFCSMFQKASECKAVMQIDSSYLQIPYLAYVDRSTVLMTETPNELRCIPYSTDGRGLTPALRKWCDASFTTLFLAMAERVTRSFGFVFKNKNQYGTARIGSRKIKFEPRAGENDVNITITARNSVCVRWRDIPGTNHLVRMSVVLLKQDLTAENFK